MPKILFAIILFLFFRCSLFGQKEKLNYDYMIDTYPKIEVLELGESTFKMDFSGEFIEAVEMLAQEIYNQNIRVKRLSGMLMSSSGVYPRYLLKLDRWMRVIIDDKGDIVTVDVYTGKGAEVLKESNEFKRSLEGSTILPATKDSESVKCILFYQIEYEE